MLKNKNELYLYFNICTCKCYWNNIGLNLKDTYKILDKIWKYNTVLKYCFFFK